MPLTNFPRKVKPSRNRILDWAVTETKPSTPNTSDNKEKRTPVALLFVFILLAAGIATAGVEIRATVVKYNPAADAVRIELQSEPGNGGVFTVCVPVSKEIG